MKNKEISNKPSPQRDINRLIVILFVVFIVVPLILLDRLSNKPAIRQYCRITTNYAAAHKQPIKHLMSSLFDQAALCGNQPSCLSSLKDQISTSLGDDYFKLDYAPSTYFVRANQNGLIEKMFLGGDYYAKTPETVREKFFLWHLNHGIKICDYFWKDDVTTSSMTYLRDIVGEAEILVPTGKYDDYRTGIVRVWGD